MPKIVTDLDNNSVYYYDNRKSCRVALPDIEMHSIYNAEQLNFHGKKHCDLIFIGKDKDKDEDIFKIYLVELRDIRTPERSKIEEALSPEVISKKAEGALDMLEAEIKKLLPDLNPKSPSFEIHFILILGPSGYETLCKMGAIYSNMKTSFNHLIRRGLKSALANPCEQGFYHVDSVSILLGGTK